MSGCKSLVSKVFGRLTVLSRAGSTKQKQALWECLCECGSSVIIRTGDLTSGKTQSCGCLHREACTRHGMYKNPVYSVWASARSRTINDRDTQWMDYGGRGIRMCQEWQDSFENFWTDMGATWKEGLTLDRIDVNGDYYKENCRWTTPTVQMHNRRKWKTGTSSFWGVSVIKKTGRFKAEISFSNKREWLGSYLLDVDAATAYDNRSEELYGDRPNKTKRKEIL